MLLGIKTVVTNRVVFSSRIFRCWLKRVLIVKDFY